MQRPRQSCKDLRGVDALESQATGLAMFRVAGF